QPEPGAEIDDRYQPASDLDDTRDEGPGAGNRSGAAERLHLEDIGGGKRVLAARHLEDHMQDAHAAASSPASVASAGRSSTNVGCPSPRSVAPATPGTRTSASSRGRTTTSCWPT